MDPHHCDKVPAKAILFNFHNFLNFLFLPLCRQRKTFRRKDGTFIYFEDSAGVIVNNKGEMKGSAITGTFRTRFVDPDFTGFNGASPQWFRLGIRI
jgi:hypothetical protein